MNCGIYKIINKISGKFYLGSSVNIKSRISNHYSNLNNNKHSNKYLQNAWNKDGKDCFYYEIVESCVKEKLIEREQYWLDLTKCYCAEIGYNFHKTACAVYGGKRKEYSNEVKQKFSRLAKERWKTKEYRDKMTTPEKKEAASAWFKKYWSKKENKKKSSVRTKAMWKNKTIRSKIIKEKIERAKTKKGRENILKANAAAVKASCKTYKIIKPDGEIIIVTNLAQFCRETGMKHSSFTDVLKGRAPAVYGWKIEYYS